MTVPPDSSSDAALNGDCDAAIQRLVTCLETGARPADDPRLAAHLGSCLGCFRAAADLKEVPRLAALLRPDSGGAAPSTAADPGPAFWAAMPAQLGAAFDQRRAGPAVAQAPARPAIAPEQTAWERFVRWIRMPVPAAMAGAACATAVALVVMRPPSLQQALGPLPVTAVDEDGAAQVLDPSAQPLGGLLGQEDVSFAQSGSVYDSVQELDTGALARVRDSFGTAVDQAMAPRGQLAADDDDPGMGATSTAPNPATVSDDLDELDEQGLQALRAQLGGAR